MAPNVEILGAIMGAKAIKGVAGAFKGVMKSIKRNLNKGAGVFLAVLMKACSDILSNNPDLNSGVPDSKKDPANTGNGQPYFSVASDPDNNDKTGSTSGIDFSRYTDGMKLHGQLEEQDNN